MEAIVVLLLVALVPNPSLALVALLVVVDALLPHLVAVALLVVEDVLPLNLALVLLPDLDLLLVRERSVIPLIAKIAVIEEELNLNLDPDLALLPSLLVLPLNPLLDLLLNPPLVVREGKFLISVFFECIATHTF